MAAESTKSKNGGLCGGRTARCDGGYCVMADLPPDAADGEALLLDRERVFNAAAFRRANDVIVDAVDAVVASRTGLVKSAMSPRRNTGANDEEPLLISRIAFNCSGTSLGVPRCSPTPGYNVAKSERVNLRSFLTRIK
jgi:hypothetical protein